MAEPLQPVTVGTVVVAAADSPSANASADPIAAPSAQPVPAPTMTEQVFRPEPGTLARGRWEASPWAFYVMGGAVVLLAALYGAFRLGLFRRRSAAKR